MRRREGSMKTQEVLWSSSAANRPERGELHMYHAWGRNFNVRLCQNPEANPSTNVLQPKQQQCRFWNIILCTLKGCKLQIYQLHLMPPPQKKNTSTRTSNCFLHEGFDLQGGSAPLAHKTGLQYGWQPTLISSFNVSNHAFSDLLTATDFIIFPSPFLLLHVWQLYSCYTDCTLRCFVTHF
jgi:hypothetical protein